MGQVSRQVVGAVALGVIMAVAGCNPAQTSQTPETPKPVMAAVPDMRWGERAGSGEWTKATLAALEAEGVTLLSTIPSDVANFCPGYETLDRESRKHFWAGLLSALAKHESSFNPGAKGGGGRYLGLLQISPRTAQSYNCNGTMLNGSNNMACAVKIAARNVSRDNAIVGGSGGWRGIARDWMPLRSSSKRADIATWTRQQSYCNSKG